MKGLFWSSIIVVGLLLFAGCSSNTEIDQSKQSIDGTHYVLGTIVTIKIYDHGTEALLQKCFDRLTEIEQLMSASIEDSDVNKINQSNRYTEVSDDVLNVIEAGIEYGELSNGMFDISLGPVIDLWGIGTEDAKVPEKKLLEEKLSYVNYKAININEDNHVKIEKGMKIDLGGIAKGYAADEVEKILVEHQVTSAIINLGGNIKVLGEKGEGVPFKVGIQGPEELRNQYIGVVEATDKTIVTSGDYERYFIEEGIKYHHIFDSTSGYPVATDVAAVTVVTQESMLADAMSTILYTMAIEDGLALVDNMDGVECIYVTKNYEVYSSAGLMEPTFKLTDDMYRMKTID